MKATIEEKKLTDGSEVYNVHLRDCAGMVTVIACVDYDHASELVQVLARAVMVEVL